MCQGELKPKKSWNDENTDQREAINSSNANNKKGDQRFKLPLKTVFMTKIIIITRSINRMPISAPHVG